MAEAADYYAVLGVPRDADAQAIREAFRRLALQYHPDRNKAPDAEERFKAIAEAYAVLSDPDKRAAYDARGAAGVAGYSPEDLFGGIDFEELFGDLLGGGLGFDIGGASLFDRLFRRTRPGPVRGEDLRVGLSVPLERVVHGGEERVRYRRPIVCPECGGTGGEQGTGRRECPRCGGTGRLVTEQRGEGGVRLQRVAICPRCNGAGTLLERPCPACGGTGRGERVEELTVSVPAGVEEGTSLRIPGHGLPAPTPQGESGDLYVVVTTRPDSRFHRAGADLWREEAVGPPEAVLGTELTVPTLEDPVAVAVPPGTQPDTVLRLRGKGLPRFGGEGRGDLNLRIQVRIPEHPTPEERRLYQRLRELGPDGGEGP